MADAVSASVTTEETTAFPPGTVLGADGLPAQPAAAPAVPDKFKNADGSINTDALLASYTELEKKQGATTEKPAVDPAADKTGEQPPVSEAEKAAADVLKAKGLELTPFNEEFAKDGKLSDDSYTKLAEAGYDKQTVDTYIRGVQASNADAEATVADIKSVAGGDEGYKNMLEWAATLPKEKVAEFNEAVSSGKPGVAKAAVQALKAEWDAAEGREPSLIGGGPAKQSGESFRSWAEVQTAMKDPRYGKDPAYTNDVAQKCMRSNY